MNNSKLIDLNLKTILVNSFDFQDSDFNEEGTTFAQQAQEVLKGFESEYNYPQNKIRYPNKIERVASWLQGLPSQCTVPFMNGEIIECGVNSLHLKSNASENVQCTYINSWFLVMANKLVKLSEMKTAAEKSLVSHISTKGA